MGTRNPMQTQREFSLIARKFCFVTVLPLAINCLGFLFASTSFKPFCLPSNLSSGPPTGIPGFPGTFQEAPAVVLSPSFQDQMIKSTCTLLEGWNNTGQNKKQSKGFPKFSTQRYPLPIDWRPFFQKSLYHLYISLNKNDTIPCMSFYKLLVFAQQHVMEIFLISLILCLRISF